MKITEMSAGTTGSGSIGSVDSPVGATQKRIGSLFKGKTTNKPFYEDNPESTVKGPHGELNVDRSKKGVTKVSRKHYDDSYPGTPNVGKDVQDYDLNLNPNKPHISLSKLKKIKESTEQHIPVNDYDQWREQVGDSEIHPQRDRIHLVAQSWDGETVGEFNLKNNQGWVVQRNTMESAILAGMSEARLREEDAIFAPGQLSKRSRGFMPHGTSRVDHEVEMAKSDLVQCVKNSKQIHKLIKDISEQEGLEGWVQEKITKAEDYLNTVREYLEGKQQQGMAEGKNNLELYGLHIGDTVRAEVNGNRVQGDIIDIFPEEMQVELLLRGPHAGKTITVDVRDTEYIDEQGVAEATGDPKFDKMLKGITGKRQVAKQQKADTKQQARDAFGGMFGGANPADSFGIRKKGVAEGAVKTLSMDLRSLSDKEFFAKYKKTKIEARAGLKGLSEERTETKNEKGEVTSWKDESDWHKAGKNKDGRGKVANLSDKARRETEKLTKKQGVNENSEDIEVRLDGKTVSGPYNDFDHARNKASKLISYQKGEVAEVYVDGKLKMRLKLNTPHEHFNEQNIEEESKGLWANIHAKRERIKHGSGEHMRKPGSKGAPTKDALRKSAK
jgi:hypothetical protein